MSVDTNSRFTFVNHLISKTSVFILQGHFHFCYLIQFSAQLLILLVVTKVLSILLTKAFLFLWGCKITATSSKNQNQDRKRVIFLQINLNVNFIIYVKPYFFGPKYGSPIKAQHHLLYRKQGVEDINFAGELGSAREKEIRISKEGDILIERFQKHAVFNLFSLNFEICTPSLWEYPMLFQKTQRCFGAVLLGNMRFN